MSYDRRPRASHASVKPRRLRTRNGPLDGLTFETEQRITEGPYRGMTQEQARQAEEGRRVAAAAEARRAADAEAARQQAAEAERARREAIRQQELAQQRAIAAAYQSAAGRAQAQQAGQVGRQSVAASAQQRSASMSTPSVRAGGSPSMAPSGVPMNLPKVGAGMKGGYRKLHTFADPRTANPNYRPRHDYEDDEFEVSRSPIRTPRHVKIDPLTALTHIDRSADRDRERRERARRASKRAANPPMRNYSLEDIEDKFGKAERRIASKMCDNGNCFMVFSILDRSAAPLYVKDFRAASRVSEDIGTGATIAEIFARVSNPRGPRR
jgi:hypothetical protein